MSMHEFSCHELHVHALIDNNWYNNQLDHTLSGASPIPMINDIAYVDIVYKRFDIKEAFELCRSQPQASC